MRAMIVVACGVLWLSVWQQAKKPGEEKVGLEKNAGNASKLVNPVKASPESIAQGKEGLRIRLYDVPRERRGG